MQMIFAILFQLILTIKLIELLNIDENIHRDNRSNSMKSVRVYSTEIIVRCLALDSFIRLSTGETKEISLINDNDRILTEGQAGEMISTSLMTILHRNTFEFCSKIVLR